MSRSTLVSDTHDTGQLVWGEDRVLVCDCWLLVNYLLVCSITEHTQWITE